MHVTDAAASGFFDVFNNQWDKNLIALAGNGFTFPKVYSELKILGYSKKYDLEVFCGVGDQQASLFGAGLTSDKLVVNIGTGGQVAGLQGQFETDGNYQIRPYFNGERIRTITHLPSGRALKAFVEFVFGENASDSDYEAFIKNPSTQKFDWGNYGADIKQIIEKENKKKNYILSKLHFYQKMKNKEYTNMPI
jgi:sugar (pentulose or hexulose) kinase